MTHGQPKYYRLRLRQLNKNSVRRMLTHLLCTICSCTKLLRFSDSWHLNSVRLRWLCVIVSVCIVSEFQSIHSLSFFLSLCVSILSCMFDVDIFALSAVGSTDRAAVYKFNIMTSVVFLVIFGFFFLCLWFRKKEKKKTNIVVNGFFFRRNHNFSFHLAFYLRWSIWQMRICQFIFNVILEFQFSDFSFEVWRLLYFIQFYF